MGGTSWGGGGLRGRDQGKKNGESLSRKNVKEERKAKKHYIAPRIKVNSKKGKAKITLEAMKKGKGTKKRKLQMV